jgi:maltose O-acetyltransferase
MNKFKRIFRYDLPLHLVLLFTNWLPDLIIFIKFRGFLASFFLGECGKNFRLGRNVVFYNPKNIIIKNNVYIAYGNWFSAGELILIQSEVIIGPYSVFASSNHLKKNHSFRYGEVENKKIKISFGTWIGANSTITAGVSLGKSCLVGANSCVTKSFIEENVLIAGVPAKIIKGV